MEDALKNKTKIWLTLISIVVLVMVVRVFCVSSRRIYTHSMENALSKGDFVLVSKDLAGRKPQSNDILLYKSPLFADSTASTLFLSRCMAMPGDTFRVEGNTYYLNNQAISLPAETLSAYHFPSAERESVERGMKELKIPMLRLSEGDSSIALTDAEYCTLRCMMSSDTLLAVSETLSSDYQVILPRKDRIFKLDSVSLPLYKEAILRETNGQARFREGKLYIKGKEQSFFYFKEDYYWLLADNRVEGIDSRFLGLVPASKVVGRVFFCWYSAHKSHRFKVVQ